MPDESNQSEQMLTVDEVAQCLRVQPVTVRVWLRSGRLRGVKAGPKLWRIPRSAVVEFMRRKD